MDRFIVRGGHKLRGTVRVGGAKNSSLPILAGCLLADGVSVIRNVPDLRDVRTMLQILGALGARAERKKNGDIEIDATELTSHTAPYELVSTMRGSVCVLGPLLARLGVAKVSHPGGCVIGSRPIDLHLKGLRALGARISIRHGYIMARGDDLAGTDIFLGGLFGSSCLATANVMMAAVYASGSTVIENAASEPEMVDLANYLNKMGAVVRGAGTHRIEVVGVRKLRPAKYTVMPDRIEAGTFMMASAITKGEVGVEGAPRGTMAAVFDVLARAGVRVEADGDTLWVRQPRKIKATEVATLPYPGFPTDLQAQLMAMMCVADGISVLTEKVFPDRFMHVAELARMGADILREGPRAIVKGGAKLSGAPVMASDLRASAALVLAGLAAKGETSVARVYHLDRGYERLDDKLRALGADVERVKD